MLNEYFSNAPMKTTKINFKSTAMLIAISTVILSTNLNAQQRGSGIGGNNGASISHSANVNPNNNGNAGQGNQGNGVGNNPYGNQGSNDNPNGRAGGGDSIPLDGGLSILLAAAAFFGIKKLRGNKKNVM